MAAMLEVKDIHCGYDGTPVIRGLSLEVNRGEIVAIIGANGAGKSTTMRAICGLLHPERGQILLEGEDISRSPASANIRKGLSYIPEGRRLFPKLTVRENLELGAFTVVDRKVIDERLEEMFALFPRLKDRSSQTAETLSGGEQQMCAIARGLMSASAPAIVSEPSCHGTRPKRLDAVEQAVGIVRRRRHFAGQCGVEIGVGHIHQIFELNQFVV